MDALFYSRTPEDHVELAREVAKLDPEAFASLARAMNALVNDGAPQSARESTRQVKQPAQEQTQNQVQNQNRQRDTTAGLTPAQMDFFHSTNAAAVSSVVDAIESQVERLLPEGISKSARNRVVGEIYRELDTTLREIAPWGSRCGTHSAPAGSMKSTSGLSCHWLPDGHGKRCLPSPSAY